jgi:mono/diheme cytochrome c family protein
MDLRYKRQYLRSFNFRNNLTSFKFFLIHLFFTLFLILPFTNSFAQDVDITAGKSLFNANCAACHKLDKKMTGPALRHAENRLLNDEGLDKQWIYAWIRNSSAVIKSGDSYANKIYTEYNRSAMTAYPQLSDIDIENILAYTAQEKPIPIVATVVSTAGASSNDLGLSNEIILGIFSLLFFL